MLLCLLQSSSATPSLQTNIIVNTCDCVKLSGFGEAAFWELARPVSLMDVQINEARRSFLVVVLRSRASFLLLSVLFPLQSLRAKRIKAGLFERMPNRTGAKLRIVKGKLDPSVGGNHSLALR